MLATDPVRWHAFERRTQGIASRRSDHGAAEAVLIVDLRIEFRTHISRWYVDEAARVRRLVCVAVRLKCSSSFQLRVLRYATNPGFGFAFGRVWRTRSSASTPEMLSF